VVVWFVAVLDVTVIYRKIVKFGDPSCIAFWWVLETHLFRGQKVNGQGHNVCVGLQREYFDAGCIRKPRWVYHAVMPCLASHATVTCVTYPRYRRNLRWVFFRHGTLYSCECQLLLVFLCDLQRHIQEADESQSASSNVSVTLMFPFCCFISN